LIVNKKKTTGIYHLSEYIHISTRKDHGKGICGLGLLVFVSISSGLYRSVHSTEKQYHAFREFPFLDDLGGRGDRQYVHHIPQVARQWSQ